VAYDNWPLVSVWVPIPSEKAGKRKKMKEKEGVS
jgi:hypothetical protein